MSADTTRPPRYRKTELPEKPCTACGRPMSWRKRWARSWDEVKYCSDACRLRRGASARRPADVGGGSGATGAASAVTATPRRSRRG